MAEDLRRLADVDVCSITSTSLIESPLICELLISHGLLLKEPKTALSRSDINNPNDEDDYAGDYECNWESCNMVFCSRKDLASHVNNVHCVQDENSLYRCHWVGCHRQGKTINARYRMLIHVRTHTHEKPHGCTECGKKFTRLENLRIHVRSHTGEKPYVCSVPGCSKAYSNSSDRFKHYKTHQVDRPYMCKVKGCDKRYTDPSSLRKHMKSNAHKTGDAISDFVTPDRKMVVENVPFPVKENTSNITPKTPQSGEGFACKYPGCEKRYAGPKGLRKHLKAYSHDQDGKQKTLKNILPPRNFLAFSSSRPSDIKKTCSPTKEIKTEDESSIKGCSESLLPLDLSVTNCSVSVQSPTC